MERAPQAGMACSVTTAGGGAGTATQTRQRLELCAGDLPQPSAGTRPCRVVWQGLWQDGRRVAACASFLVSRPSGRESLPCTLVAQTHTHMPRVRCRRGLGEGGGRLEGRMQERSQCKQESRQQGGQEAGAAALLTMIDRPGCRA